MGNLLVLGINFMLETKFTLDGTRHMVNNSKSRRKMGKRRRWLLNIKRDNYHGQRICLSKNERNHFILERSSGPSPPRPLPSGEPSIPLGVVDLVPGTTTR